MKEINNFNNFSMAFKRALETEIERFIDKETKEIREENKRLQAEVIRLVRIVKRHNEEKKQKRKK